MRIQHYFLRLRFTLILSVFFVSYISAQTSVSGTVLDSNGVPLPYTNIYFKNSSVGTFSNVEGKFSIETDETYKVLSISSVGFEDKDIRLRSSRVTGLKIVLEEGQLLDEVIVLARPEKRLKKKENPAYRIMRKVWKHIGSSGLDKAKSYQYKKYTSRETGINNIDTVFIRSILGENQNLKEILKLIKKNNNIGNKLYVPLDIEERISNVYGNNILGKKKEEIIAERKEGVNMQGFLFNRMGVAFDDVDIYRNNFQLFNTSFSSPISKGGFGMYDYVLQDSTSVGKKKYYTIYFFQRRDGDFAFEGHFKVEHPSYAVTSISMKLSKNNNINLIRDVFVKKQYEVVNDSTFVEKENYYEANYTLFSNSDTEKGLYLRKTEVFESYIFDQSKSNEFYEEANPKTSQNQFLKPQSFWNKTSLDDVNTERMNYLKQVKDNKKINRITNITNMLVSGYIPLFKNIQWGRYWNTFTYNDIEGVRIRFGIRTFRTLNDRFISTAYLSYGTLDTRLKYGLDSRYLVSQYPRIILNGVISKDFQQTSAQILNRKQTIINVPFLKKFAFVRGKNFYLTDIFKKSLGADVEVKNNFHIGAIITHESMTSANPQYFDTSFLNGPEILKDFHITKLSVYTMLTPGRKAFGLGAVQRFARNQFPTILIRYTKSSQQVFSDLNFDKIHVLYSHPILLGGFGVFDPAIQFGKTFGTLPVNILDAIPGDQSYKTSRNSFSLLNYFDFVVDEYAMFFAEHRFNGFIMNKIPWINRLKLRLLIFSKGAYGTISDDNRKANKGNIIYNTLSNNMYLEYGFGFYNIGFGNMRFFRVEFTWRNNLPKGFKQNKYASEVPEFGIRVGFEPKF